MLLSNLILPGPGISNTFDVDISDKNGTIISIQQNQDQSRSSSPPSRVLPTLCHPHVHLDKAYLLTSHSRGDGLPNYLDLAPQDGSFTEALAYTSKAKERYTQDDLVQRGSQLIAESIQAGVTSMRAFVEVDHVTEFKCIESGTFLKHKFEEQCFVQLCIFAQDPVINKEKHGEENRRLVEEALSKYSGSVDVLGSTPYVEGTVEMQRQNIDWAVELALKLGLHLDLHLDYNLDSGQESLVWYVIEKLERENWVEKAAGKTVVLGHCTRLTLFSVDEMIRLAHEIQSKKLPIHFVGLPTSDLFMMGRPTAEWTANRPRGTLQVLDLINKFKVKACIGINNVGNAFTPWGSADPLRLASQCVGLYQAGTPRDAEILFECVSALAQEAIGLKDIVVRSLEEGAKALFLIIKNDLHIEVGGIQVPGRQRLSVADIIWDPPETRQRRVIGKVKVG